MCVILANGDFPRHPVPLSALADATSVYCCDGAAGKLAAWVEQGHRLACREVYVVGDGDSLSQQERTQACATLSRHGYTPRFEMVEEQEDNDLTKTFRHAARRGERDFVILGATGLREDHTLGNISLLATYLPHADHVRMVTDHGTFTPVDRTTTFPSFRRQQVSIFHLNAATVCSAEGLVYPIEHRTFRQWWEGTLNEAQGDTFTLRVESPAEKSMLLIFQTHEKKA